MWRHRLKPETNLGLLGADWHYEALIQFRTVNSEHIKLTTR
jgi:hypothetical protein